MCVGKNICFYWSEIYTNKKTNMTGVISVCQQKINIYNNE